MSAQGDEMPVIERDELRIVSVGYQRGPIVWVAEGNAEPRPVRMTDAEAFRLVDQLVRAIKFPEDPDA